MTYVVMNGRRYWLTEWSVKKSAYKDHKVPNVTFSAIFRMKDGSEGCIIIDFQDDGGVEMIRQLQEAITKGETDRGEWDKELAKSKEEGRPTLAT